MSFANNSVYYEDSEALSASYSMDQDSANKTSLEMHHMKRPTVSNLQFIDQSDFLVKGWLTLFVSYTNLFFAYICNFFYRSV